MHITKKANKTKTKTKQKPNGIKTQKNPFLLSKNEVSSSA